MTTFESIEDVDGIGPKRAVGLRESGFETIDALRTATERDLQAVSGIGPSLAARIKNAVGKATRSGGEMGVLRVSGRAVDAEGEAGIHGLRVELWEEGVVDGPLTETRTDAEGRFAFALTWEDDPRLLARFGDEPASVHVRVYDRDGEKVHTTAHDPRAVETGGTVRLEVKLDPESLKNHRSRPTSWEHSGRSLVPTDAQGDIEDAIGLLAGPGDPGHNAYMKAARCPGPIIDDFGHSVIDDAWGTIHGDPGAGERFRDTLDAVRSFRNEEMALTADSPVVEALFDPKRQLGEGATWDDDRNRHSATRALSFESESGLTPVPFPGPDPVPRPGGDDCLVGPGIAIPLLGAAAMVGDDRTMAMEYAGVVLEQFCQAEFVGSLHRAARHALGGHEGALDRWRGFVEVVGVECGPDDGPIPDDPFPPRRPPGGCRIPPERCTFTPCLDDTVRQLIEVGAIPGSGVQYRVTQVTPNRACPGEVVTIRGTGFGSKGGGVRLGGKSAEVLSWTTTEIRIRIPDDADCGLSLSIHEDTVEICGRFIDVFRRGTVVDDFEGGAASIDRFLVDGDDGTVCITPGASVRATWETCAADSIEIEVQAPDGTTVASHTTTDASGGWRFSAPSYTETTRLTVTLTARGQCDPSQRQRRVTTIVHLVPSPRVDGMEVTQAIQFYGANQHLTDASDRGPDNSLQIVDGKPAWVRVYVRSGQVPGFNTGEVEGVTGRLLVEQFQSSSWTRVAVLSPQNPGGTMTAAANPPYTAERGTLGATLNFVVPANRITGRVRFRIELSVPDPCASELTDTDAVTVNATLEQTLRLAGIMVGYNGPNAGGTGNIQLAAPTLPNLQTTAARSYTVFPVQSPRAGNFRNAGSITLTQPLTGAIPPSGGCPQSWVNLMTQVRNVMAADSTPNGWVFYGLLANGIPMGPVVGCGGGGVGTGGVGAQWTLAHEVGHALGLGHAPCNNPPNPDANYPAYEPYDTPTNRLATIGEYGLDINNGTIHPPTDRDLMSYCGNRWLSIYHHRNLMNVGRLTPRLLAPSVVKPYADGGEGPTEPAPHVSLTGEVDSAESVSVTTVARLRTRGDIEDGTRTELLAELIDDDGEVRSSAPVYAIQTETHAEGGCSCGGGEPDEPPYVFHALVPDPETGSGGSLRIRDGEDVLWERHAPETEPKIGSVEAGMEDEQLHVQWEVDTAGEVEPEAWLRWSDDGGETWRVLTVGVRGDEATVDASHLPVGSVAVELLVHDGFYTASKTLDTVEVPPRPPSVALMHPTPEETIGPDVPLRLWGLANEPGAADAPDEAMRWTLDGDSVATGSDVWVDNPGPGEHTATLRVEGEHGTASDSVDFTVRKRDDESA